MRRGKGRVPFPSSLIFEPSTKAFAPFTIILFIVLGSRSQLSNAIIIRQCNLTDGYMIRNILSKKYFLFRLQNIYA